MLATVTDRSLAEVASMAGVTPRTIRYYIAQGLLPPPDKAGPRARYGDEHLARLRLIKQLQAEHLPLAEIRGRLAAIPPAMFEALARRSASGALAPGAPAPGRPSAGTHARTSESAVEYIRGVLEGRALTTVRSMVVGPMTPPAELDRPAFLRRRRSAAFDRREPDEAAPAAGIPPSLGTAAFDVPDETLPEPSGELARSQWDRVRLAPDVELHVRRPLSRPLNKKVEHLIRLARQLLEEDQP